MKIAWHKRENNHTRYALLDLSAMNGLAIRIATFGTVGNHLDFLSHETHDFGSCYSRQNAVAIQLSFVGLRHLRITEVALFNGKYIPPNPSLRTTELLIARCLNNIWIYRLLTLHIQGTVHENYERTVCSKQQPDIKT